MTIRPFRLALPAALAGSLFAAAPAMADIAVAVSIKPIHSIVARIMQGAGEPALIVEGAGSPHSYALKPSKARALQDADVIVWVGHELEAFLEKPLETLGGQARIVELMDVDGVEKLEFRDDGAFEAGEHEKEREHGKKDEQEHGHGHGGVDPHVWLDPDNAPVIADAVAAALATADPANAQLYEKNADAFAVEVETLAAEIDATLAPVRETPFVVFHDGYRYFEHRFDLHAVGAITVSPEVMPGAERVAEIRDRVRELGAKCVFAEPQFEPDIVKTVIEGSDAKSGVLDPLGADLADGPGLYPALLKKMAAAFRDCLGG